MLPTSPISENSRRSCAGREELVQMQSEGPVKSDSSATCRLHHVERIAMLTAIIFWSLLSGALHAQSTPDLAGNWQGTVEAGRGFQIILQISQADQSQAGKSAWKGVFYTMGPDGARESDLTSMKLEGTMLRFTTPPDGSFEGKLGADGKSMNGTLKHGAVSYALILARATTDTAWAVPQPTDRMPPDAAPEFEVATIKPTDPSWTSRGFHAGGRRISCDTETVDDIISFAYGVHVRQIVGGAGLAWHSQVRR